MSRQRLASRLGSVETRTRQRFPMDVVHKLAREFHVPATTVIPLVHRALLGYQARWPERWAQQVAVLAQRRDCDPAEIEAACAAFLRAYR